MRRRPLLLLGLAVAVSGAVAAGALVASRDDPADPRAGSQHLGTGPPLEITRVPAAYAIDYRVELRSGDDVIAGSERLQVRRPFEARLESFDGPQPGGEPSSVQVAAFGRFRSDTAGAEPFVVADSPGVPPFDVRLDDVVGDAIELGLLEPREHRRVLGRRCQVYRTGALLRAVDLAPPGDGQHVDACVDEAGLVLEEVLVADGAISQRRVALAVDESPQLDDDHFETGDPTIPPREGGGVVSQVRSDSRTPESFWELPTDDGEPAPIGSLEHRGRYIVVPPQPEEFTEVLQRNRRVGLVTDVYVSGSDVLLVERGGSLGGVDVIPDVPHARPVQLGALGEGQLVATSRGLELRADLGGGRFVRVTGTTEAELLLATARALREVEGGELVVVEPAGQAQP